MFGKRGLCGGWPVRLRYWQYLSCYGFECVRPRRAVFEVNLDNPVVILIRWMPKPSIAAASTTK